MNEIEALAEAKAIRNGDIARFRIERHGACELFGSTGTYERYMMEAEEALEAASDQQMTLEQSYRTDQPRS